MALAVIDIEAKAIADLAGRIGPDFVHACRFMYDCEGRIVVLGMGKSGHIGEKIAATLASTGSPAFFVHPGEASHGDMGMITSNDVVLALSNSGETTEILTILPLIKRLGVPLVALTGKVDSTLAEAADAHLDVSVEKEACPLGLAPTSSTTAALVMGDALAVSLLEQRGFTADDFALSHPGGSLGRRLLLHVEDIMHGNDSIPCVSDTASLSEALLEMTQKGLGMTGIVDADGKLAGIFTDGDLRRVLDHGEVNVHQIGIAEVMTRHCKTAQPRQLAVETLSLMEQHKINSLMVVDEQQQPVGALNMHDLLRAGVV
ncbi:MAG: KpsF/GutQ family sugar-phosphate isomerase [Gammaproteobacteria bacterium]|nr:KpsF/GutQ family sugar-phosphate isomerase [Gammaproteobacteria bacterium]MCF6259776.1 KpsF/GutQ family sugar-phosphate isomerase [Gammaproteobacteria bacterium]